MGVGLCSCKQSRSEFRLQQSVEEHIEAFYSYAENLNIEEEDVWTLVFVQSLDGHARKWFKELPASSIAGIE
jgi:hypothetical protein